MQNAAVTCTDCGEPLASQLVERCPKCGSTRKTVGAAWHAEGRSSVNWVGDWTGVRDSVERHRVFFPVTLAIVLGAPFLGYWLSGWLERHRWVDI